MLRRWALIGLGFGFGLLHFGFDMWRMSDLTIHEPPGQGAAVAAMSESRVQQYAHIYRIVKEEYG